MKLQAAMQAAAEGFRVFPVQPYGKRPLAKGWTETASSDLLEVEKTWYSCLNDNDEWIELPVAQEYNVGILTSGFIVVDVDTKSGRDGMASFMALGLSLDTRIVQTPSGGFHFYYQTNGRSFRNTSGKLGEGLDTRSHNGFVLAPGSRTEVGEYVLLKDISLSECPQMPSFILEKLTAPLEKQIYNALPEHLLDHPNAIVQATQIALNAEPAVAGRASEKAYRLACDMHDLALSPHTAHFILESFWGERCHPPVIGDDLMRRIENAYQYAAHAPGNKAAHVLFDGVRGLEIEGEAEAPHFHVGEKANDQTTKHEEEWSFGADVFSSRNIEHRPWTVKDFLMDGEVTLLSAAGAGGKTNVVLETAVLLAAGHGKILGYDNCHVGERLCSIVYTAEDNAMEISRRLHGICIKFGVDFEEVKPYLAIRSGVTRGPLTFAVKEGYDGFRVEQSSIDLLQSVVEKAPCRIGMIAFDPLINLHHLDENNSVQMAFLMELFRKIAVDVQCPVLITHHTHKSAKGDMNSTRGSGALQNSARVSLVMSRAEEADGATYGIPARDLPHLSYIGASKANMSERMEKRRWIRMETVVIPSGDGVGVPVSYDMQKQQDHTVSQFGQKVAAWLVSEEKASATLSEVTVYLRDICHESILQRTKQKDAMSIVQRMLSQSSEICIESERGRLIVQLREASDKVPRTPVFKENGDHVWKTA